MRLAIELFAMAITITLGCLLLSPVEIRWLTQEIITTW